MNRSLFTVEPIRYARLWVTIREDGLRCDACNQPVEVGHRVAVYDDAPNIVHHPDDGGCPRHLHAIPGDGDGGAQLELPLAPPLRLIDP